MSNKKCTGTEWDTCRVEKMGCEGCYYDYISKDKIRKKIRTLKLELEVGKKLFPPAEVCRSLWSDYEHQIEILQELLEEGENNEND